MEPKSEKDNATISSNPNTIVAHPHDQETKPSLVNQKKKHGNKNIFKVALFMMRGHHRKSKLLPVDDSSRSIWTKLVGSMRPLHLQNNNSPIQSPNAKSNTIVTLPYENQNTTDHHNEVDGFDSASDFANSPSPASSRYASAVGLNEMVQDDENHKEEENVMVEEDSTGDEMIDAKAEEFIAQFYLEMKLQNLDIMDPHYKEISMRSLGLTC
ncbi:hypothetical protein TanjilG_16952 [Lupinus angustifolius]|uniref:uncharacterized protein LOC109335288 n=1 Tax=Lupinus angustifolius TaxID=3871 RepID=UPI00090D57DF|nr:PREDICTED: uncharacterized protein LOC109335288 [Lupinus angustifolius]OIV90992.1 hypothetical protein TanjilG_16952 [Lupinus angustifolius]